MLHLFCLFCSFVALYWVFTQTRKPKLSSSPVTAKNIMNWPRASYWNWLKCKYCQWLMCNKCKTAACRQNSAKKALARQSIVKMRKQLNQQNRPEFLSPSFVAAALHLFALLLLLLFFFQFFFVSHSLSISLPIWFVVDCVLHS